MKGDYQQNTDGMPELSQYRFENIFRVFKDGKYNFYNIMKTVSFPEILSERYYFTYTVDRSLPYTALSYMMYNTIELWWLICAVNKIDDPTSFITPGTRIKIIKQSEISTIIDEITGQLSR